ncbi:MAG: sugar transporter [Verrucomicrobia bacterium]|nr:MAG: sugar transporter [Verrucomicrobiota bacterium]
MVEMFGQPDIRTVQRLTSNGEIRLPLIGRVSLRGLTVREAELEIERLYREGGYYVEPQIMLSVQQYSERYVAVFGQVRNPQRIPFPPETEEMGILQAITMAGGFTRIAKMDAVQVSRTNEKGEQERFEVDVSRLLKAKRSSDESEFKLLPGDLVFVPERTF